MSLERTAASHEQAREEALAAFRASGAEHRNCAQSVMLYALRLFDRDEGCLPAARYLGGGMGRSGRTCGAVTGAALAMGIRDEADPETWRGRGAESCAQLQSLFADFEAEFGHTDCSGLTGCDLSTTEGYRAFAKSGVREARCVGMIDWVCRRLAEFM